MCEKAAVWSFSAFSRSAQTPGGRKRLAAISPDGGAIRYGGGGPGFPRAPRADVRASARAPMMGYIAAGCAVRGDRTTARRALYPRVHLDPMRYAKLSGCKNGVAVAMARRLSGPVARRRVTKDDRQSQSPRAPGCHDRPVGPPRTATTWLPEVVLKGGCAFPRSQGGRLSSRAFTRTASHGTAD